MKTKVNLLNDWSVSGKKSTNGYNLLEPLLLTYRAPENARGWYPIGFERGHDSALDAMGWYGLKLSISTNMEPTEIMIKAHFADERSVKTTIRLAGTRIHELRIKLSDFEIESAKANIWRFLQSFELHGNAELISAELVRGEKISVQSDIRGKSGNTGDMIAYTLNVYNCTDYTQLVNVSQTFEGWESLIAEITPHDFVLHADAEQEVTISLTLHENIVPGGHENTIVRFTANGDSGSAVEVELKTLKRLPHPYIYHNEQKWGETRAKIDNYPKFKPGFDKIIADAEAWEVKPPVPVDERDYCYDTAEEHGIMSAAYAFALTKDIKYAEKVAAFLRFFIDEETGYPKKKKGCSQSYVQEGHFFQHLAIPYDIIHDSGVLTPAEHRQVEKTFRIYMDILDHHIQSGHISNWLLSEILGAMYCALSLEDIERTLRFAFGPGGLIEQLRYGVFNDGWWHECSVGYNIWVSSIFMHTAHALLPFGINILHTHFPVPFNDEVHSTYKGEDFEFRFGMCNKKWGGNHKSYVRIKDLFDAALPFLDHRGVIFGISDSDEKKLDGVHFGSTFDLAYSYYKNPEYIPVIHHNPIADPIFGHAELPEYTSQLTGQNAYADNIGIAMLRSQTDHRKPEEQIQAVIRYGSHGYAHGHYDRTNLLSVMRYGRSFYNPEHVWWGYGHFMYKFYVQTSITKNMVTVDEKMQVPSDSRRLLFYSGQALQAVAIETASQWAYPPYGGMVYDDDETLAQRTEYNASSLPEIPNPPAYGALTEFTEPIIQKRVMAVTDDYIVLFDFLKSEQEHQYDSLLQIKGFKGLEADYSEYIKHTSQYTENPLSDGQFVTDCHWYNVSGTSKASFETIFGEGEDLRGTRTFYNTPGLLKMDVYTAWPQKTVQILGRTAEFHGYNIPLIYQVETDGEIKAEGMFGAWILGEGKCDLDITNVHQLRLRVRNLPVYNEQQYPEQTKQGLFWGEAYLTLANGTHVNLSELDLVYENVDHGFGIGKDYEGGRVTIVGIEYPYAIPASPINHDLDGIITLDLTGLNAVHFTGLVGADAFPGDESQRRKTYAVRTTGKTARYITIIEPHESASMIDMVNGLDADTVEIILKDGRTQIINVNSIEDMNITVDLAEYRDGNLVRKETASGAKHSQ
ncbi:hypothetical protein [Paenibacillus maysiensis]|uniref:COG1470 family protein n=1 Tax=Paenibacillus maysiensis TaxID=1155954 RepID=UPI00046FAD2A|nr:hypothetical protein [Paenibacillus maysiensis]